MFYHTKTTTTRIIYKVFTQTLKSANVHVKTSIPSCTLHTKNKRIATTFDSRRLKMHETQSPRQCNHVAPQYQASNQNRIDKRETHNHIINRHEQHAHNVIHTNNILGQKDDSTNKYK